MKFENYEDERIEKNNYGTQAEESDGWGWCREHSCSKIRFSYAGLGKVRLGKKRI